MITKKRRHTLSFFFFFEGVHIVRAVRQWRISAQAVLRHNYTTRHPHRQRPSSFDLLFRWAGGFKSWKERETEFWLIQHVPWTSICWFKTWCLCRLRMLVCKLCNVLKISSSSFWRHYRQVTQASVSALFVLYLVPTLLILRHSFIQKFLCYHTSVSFPTLSCEPTKPQSRNVFKLHWRTECAACGMPLQFWYAWTTCNYKSVQSSSTTNRAIILLNMSTCTLSRYSACVGVAIFLGVTSFERVRVVAVF